MHSKVSKFSDVKLTDVSDHNIVGDEAGELQSAWSRSVCFWPSEQNIPTSAPIRSLRVFEIPEVLSVKITVSYQQHLRINKKYPTIEISIACSVKDSIIVEAEVGSIDGYCDRLLN
jgi:hypothetical protein